MDLLKKRYNKATDLLKVGMFVLVALVVFNSGGLNNILGTQTGTTGTGTTTNVPPPIQLAPDGVCPIGAVVEDTTVTFDMKDKYSATTTLLGSIYVKDDAHTPVNKTTDAGQVVYSPGDELEIWWNMETPAQYATRTTEKVPCLGTAVFNADVYRNGTITAQLFSEDDGLALLAADGADTKNSANSEALAAGDVVSLVGSLTGQFERGYPYGFIAVVDYNRSSIDTVDMNINGVKAEAASAPSTHSPIGSGINAAGRASKAFKIPAIVSNQKLDWTFTVDADDTIDPDAVGSPMNITFYDYDYYVSKTGAIVLNVEDTDNGVDVGGRNIRLDISFA